MGSRENLSQAIEDYLKAIHEIATADGRASTQRIAAHLQVTPASVTGMIKKLAATSPPLVDYRKHRGVVLTQAGEQVALEILHHHELIELFLHQILGYDLADVHAEADRLEHVISEEFEERISKALSNPERGSIEESIPARGFQADQVVLYTLDDVPSGQAAVIQGVLGGDPEVLRQMQMSGFGPNRRITVLHEATAEKPLVVQLEGQESPLRVPTSIAQAILVRTSPPPEAVHGEAKEETREGPDRPA
jgi:DtxR family Mn-dependent transcriptional regulator